MSNKISHLILIQKIIARFTFCSFFVKGACLITFTLLILMLLHDLHPTISLKYICLPVIPIIFFWFLDGYFLWQERLYRDLYNKVCLKNECDIDFSMDVSSLNNQYNSWSEAIISRTLQLYYLGIMSILVFFSLIFIF